MLPSGCWDAALPGDAAVGCRMLLSAGCCQLSPWLLSGREGNTETLFRSEVCCSLYLDAAPLLNLVCSSLIQELFNRPVGKKTWGCCRVGYSGGVFSTLDERPRSVRKAGGEERWRKGRRGGSAALSSFVCEHRAQRWGGGSARGSSCSLPCSWGHRGTRLRQGRAGSAFPPPFPRPRQLSAGKEGERGEGSVAASC